MEPEAPKEIFTLANGVPWGLVVLMVADKIVTMTKNKWDDFILTGIKKLLHLHKN